MPGVPRESGGSLCMLGRRHEATVSIVFYVISKGCACVRGVRHKPASLFDLNGRPRITAINRAIVNQDRRSPRQHIVRVDAHDREVMGALPLLEVADRLDINCGATGRAEGVTRLEVAGLGPLVLGLVPERVGGGNDQCGVVAGCGLDGEVDEPLVVLGDDGADDLAGGGLPGPGVGDGDLVAESYVLDRLGGAAESALPPNAQRSLPDAVRQGSLVDIFRSASPSLAGTYLQARRSELAYGIPRTLDTASCT